MNIKLNINFYLERVYSLYKNYKNYLEEKKNRWRKALISRDFNVKAILF